jgi:hypothetical protein
MIQEAKIMSKSEVKNYIDFFKKRKKEQFDFSEYSREIHNEYVKIETSIIEDYNEKLKLVEYRRKRFEKKICDCGMKMRYIKEHGFWGCPDYQNKYKKHNTFKSVYSYFPIIYSVPFNWLNTILRELICAFVVGGNSKNYLKLDELSNSRNSTDIIDKLMQYEFKINPLSPLFNIF